MEFTSQTNNWYHVSLRKLKNLCNCNEQQKSASGITIEQAAKLSYKVKQTTRLTNTYLQGKIR